MIDSDLFQEVGVNSLPWSEHVYLEANFDLLSERPLGEHGLDLGHHGGVDDAALGADGVNLLSDAGDDGEILREVRGEDPGDPVGVEILQLGDLCNRNVLSLVQLLYYCALIGRELHSDATPAFLCHKEPAKDKKYPPNKMKIFQHSEAHDQ